MKTNIKKLVFGALFSSVIFVCTAFLSFAMPGTGGYVHLGDTFIYIAAALLPSPYAMAAAAIGGAFADIQLASIAWAPFTLVIKALMAYMFTSKNEKILVKHNAFALAAASAINIIGYYAAEVIIFGNAFSPIASIPFNLMQSAVSAVIFVLLSGVLDKVEFKKRINS